jgi:hypothetical protein
MVCDDCYDKLSEERILWHAIIVIKNLSF